MTDLRRRAPLRRDEQLRQRRRQRARGRRGDRRAATGRPKDTATAPATRRSSSATSSSPARARTTGSSPTTARPASVRWMHGDRLGGLATASSPRTASSSAARSRTTASGRSTPTRGELLWDDVVADNVLSAPALADGRLILADRAGGVHAYESPGTVEGTVTGPGRRAAGRRGARRARAASRPAPTRPRARSSSSIARASTSWRRFAYGHRHRERATLTDPQRPEVETHDFSLAAGRERIARAAPSGTRRGDAARGRAASPLAGTPLEPATTAADGSFAFASVAAGSYELTARLGGYVPFATDVTVAAGEETVVAGDAAALRDRRHGRSPGCAHALARWRRATASRRRRSPRSPTGRATTRVIVANGSQDDPGEEVFRALRRERRRGRGRALIFLDTWGISYGSLLHLSRYTGDPADDRRAASTMARSASSRADEHPLTDWAHGRRAGGCARARDRVRVVSGYARPLGRGRVRGRAGPDRRLGDRLRATYVRQRPRAPLAARREPVDGADERLDERCGTCLRQRDRVRAGRRVSARPPVR